MNSCDNRSFGFGSFLPLLLAGVLIIPFARFAIAQDAELQLNGEMPESAPESVRLSKVQTDLTSLQFELSSSVDLVSARALITTQSGESILGEKVNTLAKEARLTKISPNKWQAAVEIDSADYNKNSLIVIAAIDANGQTVTSLNHVVDRLLNNSETAADQPLASVKSSSMSRCRPVKNKSPIELTKLDQQELVKVIELRKKRLALVKELLLRELSPNIVERIQAREIDLGVTASAVGVDIDSPLDLASRLVIIDQLQRSSVEN